MSDRINTATHRITKPRALAMRTIFGAFSFLGFREALAYVVTVWVANFLCCPSPGCTNLRSSLLRTEKDRRVSAVGCIGSGLIPPACPAPSSLDCCCCYLPSRLPF